MNKPIDAFLAGVEFPQNQQEVTRRQLAKLPCLASWRIEETGALKLLVPHWWLFHPASNFFYSISVLPSQFKFWQPGILNSRTFCSWISTFFRRFTLRIILKASTISGFLHHPSIFFKFIQSFRKTTWNDIRSRPTCLQPFTLSRIISHHF